MIPLTIIILFRMKGKGIRYPIIYVFMALVLNSAATLIPFYLNTLPSWLQSNNLFYNMHSITKVVLFSLYFISLGLIKPGWVTKIILPLYIIFVLINLILINSMSTMNISLFTAESIVLLVLSLLYFISSLRDESNNNWIRHPSFLIAAGVSLYEALTFFIFLFYYPLAEKYPELGKLTMKIYSISFIIFCILLALALYRSRKNKLAA